MSLYRCAVCGSSKVVPETRQEGYNKKKGILGMAFFGIGGAVAGAGGNAVVYYHCSACGHTLNRCMSEFDKSAIDRYLLEPNNEANKVCLRIEKKQYPNIEWEETQSTKEKTYQVNTGVEVEEKIDIYPIEQAIVNALFKTEIACSLSDIQLLDNTCKNYSIQQLSLAARYLVKDNILEKEVENNEVYYKPIPNSKVEALKLLHKLELEAIKNERQQKPEKENHEIYTIAIDILNALYKAEEPCTISELQFVNESCEKYSHQQKSATMKQLVDNNIVEKIIQNNKAYFKAIPDTYDKAIASIGFLLSKDYVDPKIELAKQQTENSVLKEKESIALDILEALYEINEPCIISEIQKTEFCQQYTIQVLAAIIMKLTNKKIVEKIVKDDGKAYYKAIPQSKEEAIKMLP